MNIRKLFSDRQLAALRDAAAAAERRTAGEIVVYVVGRCDSYDGALWKAAALGSVTTAMGAGLWHLWLAPWGGRIPLWIMLPAAVGAGLGWALAALVPAIGRALVADEVLEARVARRAAAAFVEEEVFDTRDRTGILLLVALFERRVVVLGDSGINARVPPEAWRDLTSKLAEGIRRRRAVAALEEAIAACGRLLEEHGVERRPDDVDELADEPRLRDG